ncbi:hypothetical protein [Pyxidicoccus xibeiensis]|uniref:hypothetical protein n=1 Tax=Pyxidicoccus xibeiensis TaxID=2906759 RepID=UPI0020A83151|nr:hypothetical protein [Pyxidicoccus xibeiensis]MCP3144939.1 hypothetical protein [Pyxidicoccus xibeiensis]
MSRVRTVDEWVSWLSTSDDEALELALEALGDALGAPDEALRERTAQLLLEELVRPGSRVQAPILSLLQVAWWPPPEHLAARAMDAVLAALARMAVEAPGVEEAALLLASLCRAAPGQLPTLEAALSHAHPAVRRAAAGATGGLGDAALSMLPQLLARLADEEPVAGAALESLGALALLAPDLTTPALVEQVRKADGARQYLALVSLRGLLEEVRRQGRSAPVLRDLEPALLRAADDVQSTLRLEAVSLLGMAGPASSGVLDVLRRHLQDSNPDVAAVAAVALLRHAAFSQEALSVLEGQLCSGDEPELQGAALGALEGVEHDTLTRAKAMLESVARSQTGATRSAVRELLEALEG